MKTIKYVLFPILFSLTFLLSCNDYLDINDNPNSIHLNKVDPELILPGALSQIFRTQAITLNRFGGLMMNSFAGNSYIYGNPFSTEYTLTVNNTFYPQIWDSYFRGTANFSLIETYDNPTHQYDNYFAIAKIMKTYYLQTIVDLYGSIPYKEAFQGQENTTPKYDSDSDVYKLLIAELEMAIELIDQQHEDTADVSKTDIIFHGDMAKWKQLANTVKLRMLLRMSNLGGELGAYRDQKLQTLANENFIKADVLINPGYSAANNATQNPFTSTYILTSSGRRPTNYNLFTVSEHFAISLNGNPDNDPRPYYQRFNGIIDGRRGRIFTLVSGALKGIRQGAVPGQEGAPADNTGVSRIGTGLAMGDAPRVTLVGASAKSGILMTQAQADFLLAEAALRYPGLFHGGEAYFESGITASFTYLGARNPNNYITAIKSRNGLGWTGSFDDKLEAIMTQKWIALTGINPTESFIEYNRTGYPKSPLPTTTTRSNRPYRLVYPNSEYVANSANVPKMSNDDAFTINQYSPFWMRN